MLMQLSLSEENKLAIPRSQSKKTKLSCKNGMKEVNYFTEADLIIPYIFFLGIRGEGLI